MYLPLDKRERVLLGDFNASRSGEVDDVLGMFGEDVYYNAIVVMGLRMRRLPCDRYLLALHSEPFYSLTCSWKCSH